jgi:hypothetical protein
MESSSVGLRAMVGRALGLLGVVCAIVGIFVVEGISIEYVGIILGEFDSTHFVGLLPSFVLLPVWLVLVGRPLHRGDEHRHVSTKGGEPAPLASS